MGLFEVIVFIVLAFVFYKCVEAIKNKRLAVLMLSLKKYGADFKNAVDDFQNLSQNNWYISDRQYRQWKIKYEYLVKMIQPGFSKLKNGDPFLKLIMDFSGFWHNGRKLFIDGFNEKFVQQESPVIKQLLSEKKIQNNNDQVTAIASDEDNTLLVAGAGTGKTTTILGKLAYLLGRVGVKPEDILVLSFTGRAVDELQDRISKKLPDKKIETLTFHSFGFSIIGKVLGQKPDLAFDGELKKKKFLDEQFDLLLKDPAYLERAVEYFAYYFKPVVIDPVFRDLNDYYQYIKTEQHITLRKEFVKSHQELVIANFLYIHGINYVYEKPYGSKTSSSEHKQYRPDFYLTDYDIYLEHFGINRKGEVHFTQNQAQNVAQTQKYQAEMAWKRDLHKKNKTKLVETFSYEFMEGNWKDKLTKKLQDHNVKFSQRNSEEIVSIIKTSGSVKQIVELFGTFLDLCKSNGYDLPKLQSIIASRNSARELAFFDIFSPIYKAYEDYLTRTNSIDFHDMLIKAANFIKEGKYKADFKYIIIDEFQDFSVSKYALIKALCDQNPDVKLFCVGDDWQSIFRFAGSDISLMTNFEESYGFTRKNQLVVTNRFNNQLAVISNRFILKNPNQIEKQVKSKENISSEALSIVYKKRFNDTEQFIEEILNLISKRAHENGKRATVFLLGRYKHNKPKDFSKYQNHYKNLSVEFLTIHASKGSEADYVIILDVLAGKYGFPAEITDDPLLEIVLSKGDQYPHAEERRLMYVAMTRAKQKVFIITEDGRQSIFVLELEGFKNTGETAPAMKCKECGGDMVKRHSAYGTFYGCSNYPKCDYKANV